MKRGAFSLDEVRFSYTARQPNVVNGVTVEIPSQRITAVLGPNGTGKTTLLHLMLGLLKPVTGEIFVAGKYHHEYSPREISRTIGLVPQFESIPFNFSVLEYVLLGRSPYLETFQSPGSGDIQIAQNILQDLGMVHLLPRLVAELSGGERQLVSIARVLAQQTKILLLDEPTAHLDLENQNKILTLLRTLTSQGISIVFTTHDPNAAIFAADNFILMNRGLVTAHGEAEAVLNAENLSSIYRIPITVECLHGRTIVLMGKNSDRS